MEFLKQRFTEWTHLHQGLEWSTIADILHSQPAIMDAVRWMEDTGGEPAVVSSQMVNHRVVIADCSTESPKGRRSVCYDDEALHSRKENKPRASALGLCQLYGVDLMSEEFYHALQQRISFDCKTSSWLRTPDSIRRLGGALFGDCRFGRSFTYHNGAESYYAVRGFRTVIPLL